MLKYIKYLLTTLLISVLLFEAVIYGIILQKKDVFDPSFQSVIVDKYRMLENTDEKKIIMIAGSSSAFGLDQDLLEAGTGYKVVNLGLHAGFGHLFHSELAKENINEGDIVLLGYEYNWIDNFYAYGQQLIMSGIDDNIDLYKHIPFSHWKDFIGYLFKYGADKNAYEGSSGNYSREAFSEENAQMTWVRDYALSDYYEKADSYSSISVLDDSGNVSIFWASIAYLKELREYVESRGASIYFVSSPVLYESLACDTDSFLKLKELEEEQIGIPYISDPRLYMFPPDLMSDAINHCNTEGEAVRTSILTDDLKACGAIEPDSITETLKDETGETFALVDSLPKRFLHRPAAVKKEYRIDAYGNEILYSEGTDYSVNYERGTISRTDNSAIPNYNEHAVAYTSGKFALINDAENQNPESNRNYQIRVDYSYYVSQEELEPIEDGSAYLSENTRQKILNGESISIALCGDSIGAGADTDGSGIFLNYLDESLESRYGIDVQTSQLSAEGGTRALLAERLPEIIGLHPDVLMVEFGMNDHCGNELPPEESAALYKSDLENSADLLQQNGIDMILIGFPQQNMTWDMENMEATRLYNEALKDISERKHLYFADVYDLFTKVGNTKPLSRDVMADYIHHPNEWGHKIYYTSIIPAFNVNGDMRPADLPNYVYVN